MSSACVDRGGCTFFCGGVWVAGLIGIIQLFETTSNKKYLAIVVCYHLPNTLMGTDLVYVFYTIFAVSGLRAVVISHGASSLYICIYVRTYV